MGKFQWNKRTEQAVLLVFQDELTDAQIASQIGITKNTLETWKRRPEFQEKLSQYIQKAEKALMKKGSRFKEKRVSFLDNIHQGLETVHNERKRQHENIDTLEASPAAGASSGLMVLTVRYLPGGGKAEEWGVDTGYVDSVLKVQKQIAQELGQWVEKIAPTDPSGKNEYQDLTDEARADRIASLLDRARERRDRQSDSESEEILS